VEQTLEFLGKEPRFTLLSRVPSGTHVIDTIDATNGLVESRLQIEGVRIKYSTVNDGGAVIAVRTFVQHGDTQIGVLCCAPVEYYEDFEELFLVLCHEIRILGPTSAPFARMGFQPSPFDSLGVTVADLSELRGLDLEGYKIYQRLALSSYSNGIDGSILVLIDGRLDGLIGRAIKDAYSGIETIHVESDPQTWDLRQGEVREALVFVIDDRHRVLYIEHLGRESARLDRVYLYEDRSKCTFVLTRDYSISFGSYNGPVSYFLEVNASGIRYILPHGLMTSLKSAWVIFTNDKVVEILSKKCRPDFSADTSAPLAFEVIYERFRHMNGVWTSALHKEVGFWENTGPLDPEEFRQRF
jgi:hypothetical protein